MNKQHWQCTIGYAAILSASLLFFILDYYCSMMVLLLLSSIYKPLRRSQSSDDIYMHTQTGHLFSPSRLASTTEVKLTMPIQNPLNATILYFFCSAKWPSSWTFRAENCRIVPSRCVRVACNSASTRANTSSCTRKLSSVTLLLAVFITES